MSLAKLAKKFGAESYVVTAIPRGGDLHVAFNVVDRHESFLGSGVIAIDRATLAASIVYESMTPCIDYIVDHGGWHCILMETGIVEVEGGKVTPTVTKLPEGLYRMCNYGIRRAIICGDRGKAVVYARRKLTNIPVDTGAEDPKYAEDLKSICFAGDRGYAVGSYGAFLTGTTKQLAPAWKKQNPFAWEGAADRRYPVLAVYVTSSGAVLLGSDEGPALVYEAGAFTKLSGLPPDAKVYAMVEYNGVEYWSADDNTLFKRQGQKLRKLPARAGGYRMEASDGVMASSCGSFVYVLEGKQWTRLRISPNPKKLVKQLALDF